MSSMQYLQDLMKTLQTDNFKGIDPDSFHEKIEEFCDLNTIVDEIPNSAENQRDETVKFNWGHNHDFGTFKKTGMLGDRHILILNEFIDDEILPKELNGKKILDVGCWTGGMAMLLARMGAKVIAIDEVFKYTECLSFMVKSFGLNIVSGSRSIYKAFLCDNEYDYVILSGVLYHITDPVAALKICFDALKVGGYIMIETLINEESGATFRYAGPSEITGGDKEKMNRTGWNWLIPSRSAVMRMMKDVGFTVTHTKIIGGRLIAYGLKDSEHEMCKAGVNL